MMMDAGLDNAGPDNAGLDNAGLDNAGLNNAGQSSSESDATSQDNAGGGGPRATPDLPDPRKLAEDWITLWQSELTAMAADPEMRESWQTVMTLWAGTMSAMLCGMPRAPQAERHEQPSRHTGTADAPRAAPAAAASDTRDAEIERLARHVAILERRLADLERGGDPPVHPKRRAVRPPRK
ncbi:MAG TPA: hypothetical protein VHU42_02365 [Rhodopila sp.]|nr:hypothetical protein [Rhodopila sp.]